jgi:hypothetical protein
MSAPPPIRPRRRAVPTVGAILLLAGLLGFLAYVVWAFQATWGISRGVQLSGHGWAALIIAFVMTGLLGGGLMWLAFYSARKGYDEGAGREEDEEEED